MHWRYEKAKEMITFKPRPIRYYTSIVFTDKNGQDYIHYTPEYIRRVNASEMLQEMVQLKYLTYEEAIRIEDMIHSDDEENLTVAEEIIYQKIG